MSTEITELESDEPAPIQVVKAKEKPKEPKGESLERPEKIGPDLRAVRDAEDKSLRELLEALGTDGAFRVRIARRTPGECRDVTTGKMVSTGGFLKTYEEVIDEHSIQSAHGGGTYELKVSRRDIKGQYKFYTQRTAVIAGEPNLDDPCLNRVHVPVASAAVQQPHQPPSESPTLAAKAFDMMNGQLAALREERERDRGPDAPSPAVMQMMQMMQTQLEASQREVAEMRKAAVAAKPPEDPFKNELLSNLMREDNGRLNAVRAQYESEIRMLKENAQADIRRLEERHERYHSEARQSHEREIANIRQSHEIALQSVRSSFETQAKLLEMEVRRSERENSELRSEVKELRAKHGKTIAEQAKELLTVKDALDGIGGGEKELGTFDKLLEFASNPAAGELAQRVIGSVRGPQAATAPPQVHAEPTRPRIVAAPDGRKYHQKANGELVPIRQKKKVIATTNPDGTPGPVLPAIPEETSALVIGFLERAFAAGTDPVLVAQSYRAQVPDEIMSVIREHGVDVYLSKVAKLQSGSPLGNQAGKNWVRRVGEALVE